jgi:hypothetical protein
MIFNSFEQSGTNGIESTVGQMGDPSERQHLDCRLPRVIKNYGLEVLLRVCSSTFDGDGFSYGNGLQFGGGF